MGDGAEVPILEGEVARVPAAFDGVPAEAKQGVHPREAPQPAPTRERFLHASILSPRVPEAVLRVDW